MKKKFNSRFKITSTLSSLIRLPEHMNMQMLPRPPAALVKLDAGLDLITSKYTSTDPHTEFSSQRQLC